MSKSFPKFKSARVSLVESQTFDYYNAADELIASFTLRFLDHSNPITKANFEEYRRKDAGATNRSHSDADTFRNATFRRAFLKSSLLDWRMDDADGNPIPFSIDMALAFFDLTDEDGERPNDEIFGTLVVYCADKSKFVQKSDVAKNS